ncbi:hypothetical protein BHE74_00045543 [Ensete ventricosum]|nr:hypothetical protein GW17_00005334 [Ensete ventricosum]RWW48382.1 hypothetical protein BHE74_00045543 [Ensete ventricosum]RZS26000.1 hypothetical protein BHM03_00059286 [Ensete ventricosum]
MIDFYCYWAVSVEEDKGPEKIEEEGEPGASKMTRWRFLLIRAERRSLGNIVEALQRRNEATGKPRIARYVLVRQLTCAYRPILAPYRYRQNVGTPVWTGT